MVDMVVGNSHSTYIQISDMSVASTQHRPKMPQHRLSYAHLFLPLTRTLATVRYSIQQTDHRRPEPGGRSGFTPRKHKLSPLLHTHGVRSSSWNRVQTAGAGHRVLLPLLLLMLDYESRKCPVSRWTESLSVDNERVIVSLIIGSQMLWLDH